MSGVARNFDTAESRWSGVGPYYAMFPVSFADKVIDQYTQPGDTVLDPFAGRGTSLFSAASKGRTGIGVELNPVGWVYAQAKLKPAKQKAVQNKIKELGCRSSRYKEFANQLPLFFQYCFSPPVQEFLLAARNELRWKTRSVDRTVMAFLLVYLHGKNKSALSNQMRQTKSFAPDYAIRWWKENDSKPPEIDPVAFLSKRVEWRYAKGVPSSGISRVYLGDSVDCLSGLRRNLKSLKVDPAQLLFTSPPYFGLTNYHYDQWLRLWLLGGNPNASKHSGKHQGKFENQTVYKNLLQSVFLASKKLLNKECSVYIRTSKQKFTFDVTLNVLHQVFPTKKISVQLQPFTNPTQTQLFGDKGQKEGEVDIILSE